MTASQRPTLTVGAFSSLLRQVQQEQKASEVAKLPNPILSGILANLASKKVTHVELPMAVPVDFNPTELDNPIWSEVRENMLDVVRDICLPAVLIPAPATLAKHAPGVTRDIILNGKQQDASDLILSGKDCIVVGAAGTGKTTLMRKTTRRLIDESKLGRLRNSTKWLGIDSYGCVVVSYTRKAVNNIRHAVVDELKKNTLTVHKLLEFAPVYYEISDPVSGLPRKTMRFEPQRNQWNPLPREIDLVVFEESSMVAVDLYEMLQDAMPHAHQEVFIGDIQQLPPTFGMAILGFKMLELPIVELTEVLRQARDSPILDVAWKILEGDPNVFSGKLTETTVDGKKRKTAPALDALSQTKYDDDGNLLGITKFQIWQKQLDDTVGVLTAGAQFVHWERTGYYNPEEDIILCPYNKAFGTIELNNRISQHMGIKRSAVVFEVIAGFRKHYLAVGDRVLYDKEDATVVNIASNSDYTGERAAPASRNLDRWGVYQEQLTDAEKLTHAELIEKQEEDVDAFMSAAAAEIEDRVNAASHGVTIRYSHSDEEQVLESAAEINNLLGGYALTVHKFQGSEADRVFLVLHNSHAKMVSRELLYTAVTRAKKFLHIICEPKSFFNGISSQRIKGNTLKEKALTFTGAKEQRDVEKKQLELEEHRKTLEASERYSRSVAAEQTQHLRIVQQEDSKVAALTTLVAKPGSILPLKYNPITGKME